MTTYYARTDVAAYKLQRQNYEDTLAAWEKSVAQLEDDGDAADNVTLVMSEDGLAHAAGVEPSASAERREPPPRPVEPTPPTSYTATAVQDHGSIETPFGVIFHAPGAVVMESATTKFVISADDLAAQYVDAY